MTEPAGTWEQMAWYTDAWNEQFGRDLEAALTDAEARRRGLGRRTRHLER